jgi:hypothetical protein
MAGPSRLRQFLHSSSWPSLSTTLTRVLIRGPGAQIAPRHRPLIVLFGQHRADQADDRLPVGKMP